MELGNLIHGNSRGQFAIDGDAWWGLFEPLFEALDCGMGYLAHHESDTFNLRPYDWEASCDCGHEERAEAWWAENDHTPACFQTRLSKRYFGEWNDLDYDQKQVLLKAFLEQERVPELGCMRRCDCGAQEKANRYFAEHDHDAACRLVQPNFLHKPTGYAFNVYKYAFRDSYANMNLTPEAVRAIVADCMTSLSPKEPLQ